MIRRSYGSEIVQESRPHAQVVSTLEALAASAGPAVAAAKATSPVAVVVVQIDGAAEAELELGPYAAAVGGLIEHALRADDLAGRADGQGRFVIVASSASAEEGRALAERLCAAIRVHPTTRARRVTISAGIAAAPEHGQTLDALVDSATIALARIQSKGGDGAAVAATMADAQSRPLSIDRFAGRNREIDSLIRWLDEAATGQPRIVSVYGRSGVGTSTLMRQLETETRLRGGLFAMVSAPEHADYKPYGVWQAFLRSTNIAARAGQRRWAELQNLEPALGNYQAPGHTGSQYRLLSELSEYVRAITGRRLLVLVLDDMHRADATSWDALEHLVGQLDADHIMICVVQGPHPGNDVAVQRRLPLQEESARELVLSNLTRDEVKQWLEGAFHGQQIERELLAFLYRHTEGNPLFISQMLRALTEEGDIRPGRIRWEWTPVSELRLPPGRRALVARRLGRFSSSTQAVLAAAAIVGREFDVGTLSGAGAGSEAAVRLAVSEAVAAGLIVPTRERRQGSYAFVHEEVADVLLGTLPRGQLAQVHLRLARWMEKRRPDRPSDVALHYDAAGVAQQAYQWAQTAAKAAERVYAYPIAGALLQIAARNSTGPGDLADVRVALAHISETGGRFDEVEELCDLAIEWFAGQGDDKRALTLRRMRERARMELGQPARVTLDALTSLDEEAVRLGFDRERVAILLLISLTHARLGDKPTSERIAAEGVKMAEGIGDTMLLADAVTRHGNSMLSDAPTRAHPILRRALELYESAGDVRGQARSYMNMGIAAQFESRLEEASQAYGRALSVARAGGMPDVWGLAALNLGVLSQKRGDYDHARELFGEALGLFAAVKHSEYQLAALFNMADADRETGSWESAAQLYDATIPLAQRIGQADIEIGAMAGAGLCALELGRLREAEAAATAVAERVRNRAEWFQGREVVEALAIRMEARAGNHTAAFERLSAAVALAETADVYTAAWIIAAVAGGLVGVDGGLLAGFVNRYADRVKKLGYAEMTRRFDELLRR
ncbi:MAG TPA: AAA family ATPase [Gemmatimonadaceae bacterium]